MSKSQKIKEIKKKNRTCQLAMMMIITT